MKQINPNQSDVEMLENDVLYIKVHFITVPLTHFRTYEDIASISKMYNCANITKIEGLINLMFQNKEDALAFAKKVNER